MKWFHVIFIAMFVIASSCQRSQFSTTTRHTQNGRVTYVNNYPKERSKISKGKTNKSHLLEIDAQDRKSAPYKTGMKTTREPGITKDNNILTINSIDLLASTSNKPIIYKTNIDLINSDNYKKNPINDHFRGTIKDSIADTIKSKTPNKDLTFDPSYTHFIKFKSGKEDSVRIISHSHDGIYYHLISEPKKSRYVPMAEVDTILTDTTNSFKQAEEIPAKKEKRPEMKGLIHSLIGFIPVAGIPFAIIGIILGARNLRRIRKNLASIKGKRIALSSVIIGIAALIFNIIITIFIITAIIASVSSSALSCSSAHF